MVVSCIFLEQKELIPHPSTFGPLKNLTITLWHPKQIPNIPRRKRKGNSGPEDREHEEQQNLIGYHGIQSAGKCPEWLLNYGDKLLRGSALEGGVIRTDIVFLSLISFRSLWKEETVFKKKTMTPIYHFDSIQLKQSNSMCTCENSSFASRCTLCTMTFPSDFLQILLYKAKSCTSYSITLKASKPWFNVEACLRAVSLRIN